MKKILVFPIVFLLVQSIPAQEIPKEERHPGLQHPRKPMNHPGIMEHHKEMMKNHIELSDAQKLQLKTEQENFHKQMEVLKKNDGITVREWRSQMQKLREDHQSKIQQVFTPDQKAMMLKSKVEMKARHENMEKERMETMKSHLGLSDEQSGKLDKSSEEMKSGLNAIRENKTLSPGQKIEQIRELRKKQMENMKSILTEEQLKMMKEKKQGIRTRT